MLAASVAGMLNDLRRTQLLEPAQCDQLAARRFSDAATLIQEMLRRDWLTPYQAKQVLGGQAANLVLGHYHVLEPLGEGGMGQVFKARHQRLKRLVALKVIRKDFVGDRETVGRFYREVQVTSRLTHPNVIRADDAGPVGDSHFLAMEYIEGIDLDRLVTRSGPLPVPQACAYLRQAALGLQAIHELGLVHRDIKPSNLLLASRERQQPELASRERKRPESPGPDAPGSPGTIKILDLGLALLQESIHGKGTTRLPDGQSLTTLTLDGPATIGSVDYMSPEQALDFHRVDIRADIYSLGCTFFYLLTGKPPFGNCALAVKLMRHQQAEPPDLARFRPDAPPGLQPILRRMLAKRPADRYQTPAEVAAALKPFAPREAGAGTTRLPAVRRFWSPRFGKARLRWLALGLLLLGIVGLLAWYWPNAALGPGANLTARATQPMRNAQLRDLPDNSWLRLGAYPSNGRDVEIGGCYDPRRRHFVRIGGRGQVHSNEIATYDLGTNTRNVLFPHATGPDARSPGLTTRPAYGSYRGTCYDRDRQCIWDYSENQIGGGVAGLWRGNDTLDQWSYIKEVPATAGCRVAYDEHARKLVCLGYDMSSFGRTYVYDPATRQAVPAAAGPGGAQGGRVSMGRFYGFLYVPELKGCLLFGRTPERAKKDSGPDMVTWTFDPFTGNWHDLRPRGALPSERQEMGLSHDRKHGVVLLFGGKHTDSSPTLDDTWLYDPAKNTWAEFKSSTGPRTHYKTRPPADGDCQMFAYDEEHNVHVLILQNWADKDSAVWVYRYKR
jgi:serine/threonine protein kinase